MNKKYLHFLLILLCLTPFLYTSEFTPLQTFQLSQSQDTILAKPDAFIVTEDNRIMVGVT